MVGRARDDGVGVAGAQGTSRWWQPAAVEKVHPVLWGWFSRWLWLEIRGFWVEAWRVGGWAGLCCPAGEEGMALPGQ